MKGLKKLNSRSPISSNPYPVRVIAFFFCCIHAIAKIAETPILSLDCVDAIPRHGLSYVVSLISDLIYNENSYCVDLALETLTGQGLLDRLPTDWVKSD